MAFSGGGGGGHPGNSLRPTSRKGTIFELPPPLNGATKTFSSDAIFEFNLKIFRENGACSSEKEDLTILFLFFHG